MRLTLFIPACLLTLGLISCHKEYTCDCQGLDGSGTFREASKDFKLAGKKDAKRLCDSLHLDFKEAYPDITDDACELR